jgi:hypothetical protein
MIDFWIYYGAFLLILGGPLVIVLWDVCITEPRIAARQAVRRQAAQR